MFVVIISPLYLDVKCIFGISIYKYLYNSINIRAFLYYFDKLYVKYYTFLGNFSVEIFSVQKEKRRTKYAVLCDLLLSFNEFIKLS